VTEPGRPALSLDRLEAVVFDTDGVLTDTASVHAAAWKRLFDEHLRLRAARDQEPFRPFEGADYLRHVDGRPRYDGVAGFLGSRSIDLPWGDPADTPGHETVCGLANAADRLGLAGKPDPALFPEPARRLQVAPARAAVVEDALAGVEAGRGGRFGVVVGVDRGGQAAALAERGADVVVADLGELALEGAPARRGGP
jgi:beta-phosphoglucomutase-like phosphatase (HAD superfamily)